MRAQNMQRPWGRRVPGGFEGQDGSQCCWRRAGEQRKERGGGEGREGQRLLEGSWTYKEFKFSHCKHSTHIFWALPCPRNYLVLGTVQTSKSSALYLGDVGALQRGQIWGVLGVVSGSS